MPMGSDRVLPDYLDYRPTTTDADAAGWRELPAAAAGISPVQCSLCLLLRLSARLWIQVSLLFCIGRHTAVNVLRIGSGVPDCLCAVLRLSTARWHGAVDELGIRYRTRRRGKQIRYKFAVKYVFFPRSLWQPGLWSCEVEKN